jgi:iron(III) transport system substrate-binding protein
MRYIPILLAVAVLAGCGGSSADLTIYSGRSKALVEPLIERFEQETGLRVGVRYGDTAQLAVALTEEGRQTSADLFWAQDAGALGVLQRAGLFAELPDEVLAMVEPNLRSTTGTWIATSGRARTLAYSATRVNPEALPSSILELSDSAYRNRVGWAPTNASFQTHVTAMRLAIGDEATRQWLVGMKENGAKSYPRNTAIVQAIADGEIDFGLPNHYYLDRFKHDDPDFPVDQTYFHDGDVGNLLNIAGIGILAPSENQDVAAQFISFLLRDASQRYFAEETFEYPVTDVGDGPFVPAQGREIDLNELRDLEATLQMFREVGIL